jgi:peptidoglycan/LPS O-acetylase OafA/YrhL
MYKPWFKKTGWIYVPKSSMGIVILLLLILFCINVFIATDRKSHSVSDTLYGIFPFVVPAFLIYLWIGSETSEKNNIS